MSTFHINFFFIVPSRIAKPCADDEAIGTNHITLYKSTLTTAPVLSVCYFPGELQVRDRQTGKVFATSDLWDGLGYTPRRGRDLVS